MSEQQDTPGVTVPEGEEILDRQEAEASLGPEAVAAAGAGTGSAEGEGVVDQQGALADELGEERR